MALTLDPATKVISVPQADLTFVSGTFYKLDTDQWRKDVFDLLASETYIWMPDAFSHFTEGTVAGVLYARRLSIINGYSVEFEDGQYSVQLEGSNNDIWDIESGILVQNQVQVIPTNSAGLQVVAGAGGGTTPEQVWAAASVDNTDPGTMGGLVAAIFAAIGVVDQKIDALGSGSAAAGFDCAVAPQVIPSIYVGHKGDEYRFPVYRGDALISEAELAGATGLQIDWENEDTETTFLVTVGVAIDGSDITYTTTAGDLIFETLGKWVGQASGTTVGGEPFKSQQLRVLVESPVT